MVGYNKYNILPKLINIVHLNFEFKTLKIMTFPSIIYIKLINATYEL